MLSPVKSVITSLHGNHKEKQPFAAYKRTVTICQSQVALTAQKSHTVLSSVMFVLITCRNTTLDMRDNAPLESTVCYFCLQPPADSLSGAS